MRVLVVGSGGREHSLVWGLARSASVDEVLCAPGNPGIEALAECIPLALSDVGAAAALADDRDVDLVLVGPEQPLVDGIVDAVNARGRLAFGPTADAAQLEGSKRYMKEVLVAAGVPTARHSAFGQDDEAAAFEFLETLPGLYVVKTDGLAAGKGVIVTESIEEARDAVRAYLSGAAFGDAGRRLVIEEGMTGPELSLLVVCNGDPDAARPLAPAQDFKRIGDGDAGPNTGGMGAYSPVPIADDACVTVVMASEHYPAEPRTGDVIEGLDDAARVEGAMVFHAGTRRDGDVIRTAGGRVLAVSATGATVEDARRRAYGAVEEISWPGAQYRRDIAAAIAHGAV